MNLQALEKLQGKRIAIIGDICLDCYYHLGSNSSEISVETGLKANAVESHSFSLGGAANVALNCKRLGSGTVDLYGVVGDDAYSLILKSILQEEGIGYSGIVTQENNWTTYVYHKIYQKDIELPRYDLGVNNELKHRTIDTLIGRFSASKQYDIILINEQFPTSLHTTYMQGKLNRIIDTYSSSCLWISDCRNLHDTYRKTIHKCNRSEGYRVYQQYHDNTEIQYNSEHDEMVVQWLGGHWHMPVVMTLGEEGAIVSEKGTVHSILGTHIIEEKDTVGAGDAFFSALACSLICDMPISEAAMLGNVSATVCIKKLHQTGNPTLAEIRQLAQDLDFRYHPELATDTGKAIYIPDSDFEVIGRSIESRRTTGPPKVVIFDHDGTISTLRQGWEQVMRVMMIDAIIGNKRDSLSSHRLEQIEHAVDTMIDQTTGVQTIIQMSELVKLIRSFGLIAEERILSPGDYKKQYNDLLLAAIAKKKSYVQRKILSVEDVTIKGAVSFLKHVAEQGALLFLASGTDVEDVTAEAELLGYAHYFNGGIFGSIGDVANDPKKIVMQNILDTITAKGDDIAVSDCFVFGDGSVEIREGRKRNFFTIGLVSDEKQRFGINWHKRKRLVLAGADLLIPDFSRKDLLLKTLGWIHG